MEEKTTVTLRCWCGQAIFCKLSRVGESLSILVFFSDGTLSERIKHCPRCAQKLAIDNLLASTLQQED
jgi:hypothetical protein